MSRPLYICVDRVRGTTPCVRLVGHGMKGVAIVGGACYKARFALRRVGDVPIVHRSTVATFKGPKPLKWARMFQGAARSLRRADGRVCEMEDDRTSPGVVVQAFARTAREHNSSSSLCVALLKRENVYRPFLTDLGSLVHCCFR